MALTSHSSSLCFFCFFPLVGLPGLISLLPHTSQMGNFHQMASCLNTRAHKTLWVIPEHIPLHPPHPELCPQACSRVRAPERSRTSCSLALLVERVRTLQDWRTRLQGHEAQDSPQQSPAEENQQGLRDCRLNGVLNSSPTLRLTEALD